MTWLPILALCAFQGLVNDPAIQISFRRDFEVHARFLFSLPILILAEIPIGSRVSHALRFFCASGLVLTEDSQRFEKAVSEAKRNCDSALAELIIVGGIAAIAIFRLIPDVDISISSWHNLSVTHVDKSAAFWWYIYFSIPIYQFFLFRWIWRLAVWTKLLWRISRLNLDLTPIHPDSMGGLGFLNSVQILFATIAFAASVVLSATIGKAMYFGSKTFLSFQAQIILYLILEMVIFLSPLLVFTKTLVRLRLRGILSYGALGTEYAQKFDAKWVHRNAKNELLLLGTADIQSLADLRNSFEIIQRIPFTLVQRTSVVTFAAAVGVPFLPLILIHVPLEEIGRDLFKLLF
jgi:hypothetical protein